MHKRASLKGGTTMRDFFPLGVIAAVAIGCGDSTDPGGGGSAGGGAGGAGGGEPGDADAPRQIGSLTIASHSYVAELGNEEGWDLQITYGELYEGPIEANCFPEQIDNCVLLDCPESMQIAPQYGSILAGTVTVSGGVQPVTVVPDDVFLYGVPGSNQEGLYAPGDAITVDIAGDGDIPAHSLTATAPLAVTIVAPAFVPPEPQASRVTIDLSQDLIVEWINGSTGRIRVGIGSHDAFTERRTILSCTADASDGQMTIPSDILTRILRTDIETETSVAITLFDSVETMAGECEVTFSIQSWASSPDGYSLSGTATLL
jgi:hypothetical protein